MKIAILTQPLISNYGGIIQNWALQQMLKKMGHEPITIDFRPQPSLWYFISENLKSIISVTVLRKKRRFLPWSRKREPEIEAFVRNNIVLTRSYSILSKSILKKYGVDAIVVGSDQVWRPRYNRGYLLDMFLRFAKDYNCLKLSYAASFGTDKWEFSEEETNLATLYIKQFNGVSVREKSGVGLCANYLGTQSSHVLDPTLLLKYEDYGILIDEKLVPKIPYVLCYVIEPTEIIIHKANSIAKQLSCDVIVESPDYKEGISLNKWLSLFYYASYVITDSFHGAAFSVNFNKSFTKIDNNDRGEARFREIDELVANPVLLEERRKSSTEYLKKYL